MHVQCIPVSVSDMQSIPVSVSDMQSIPVSVSDLQSMSVSVSDMQSGVRDVRGEAHVAAEPPPAQLHIGANLRRLQVRRQPKSPQNLLPDLPGKSRFLLAPDGSAGRSERLFPPRRCAPASAI